MEPAWLPSEVMSSPTLTISAAQEAFDAFLKRKSANTARAYRADMKTYAAWAKADSIGEAIYSLLKLGRIKAAQKVEEYEDSFVSVMAKNTTNRRISTLKRMVSNARRVGLVDWKLEVLPVKALSADAKKATAQRNMAGPTNQAFETVLEWLRGQKAIPELAPAATRDIAVFRLLQNPMLRRSEVSGLNFEDLDLSRPGDETVTVVGKARVDPVTLPIPPGVVKDLKDWLALRASQLPSPTRRSPVFVRIRKSKLMKQRFGDSGLYLMTIKRGKQALGKKSKRLNPHAMRHSGATALAAYCQENNIPFTEGMLVTRHKKLDTFLRYVDKEKGMSRKLVAGVERKVGSK